jgi:hypothetical protein
LNIIFWQVDEYDERKYNKNTRSTRSYRQAAQIFDLTQNENPLGTIGPAKEILSSYGAKDSG